MKHWIQAAVCLIIVLLSLYELGHVGVYLGGAEAGRMPGSSIKSEQLIEMMRSAYSSFGTIEGQGSAEGPDYHEGHETVEAPDVYMTAMAAAQKSGLPDVVQIQDEAVSSSETLQAQSSKQPVQNGKIVYLTFDDGPSENTELVLDILKEAGIKATFFVLGEHVKKYPEMARRIVREGHSIGNHSYNHRYDELYASFTGFAEQVIKTDRLIYDTTGVRTTLFRAPGGTYGHFDHSYFDAMAAAGYQVHDWNVDSGDSSRLGVPASEVLAEVKSSVLKDKLTVLLHDSSRHEESVKALPDIIAYYKNKGYAFASLTNKTEPIQFKVAKKLKWERVSVTEAQIKRFVAQSEALARIADQQEPKLVIHHGERQLELEQEAYGLKGGAIEVSLLKLMDWLGANTSIDKQDGTVTVSLNDMNMEWSFNETVDASGAEPFMVPIRTTLQKLGIGIAHYVYDERQREIWIAAS